MARSPLDPHAATPRELQARIEAERRGSALLVYRDADDRQAIALLDEIGDRLTIGRRSGNDIALDWDTEVSRVHAALERAGDDWLVVDDGLSRNGTWVNGARVTGQQRLRDGDVISIGATALAFVAPAGDGSRSQPTASAPGAHVGERLTPAQRRVLIALCRPYREDRYATPATNQQIADELVVSVDAVKSTLRALFTLFGVDALPQNRKRASLARSALRSGVVGRREL
jgi:pSer/pThr/pTyr-binding forkhead associated (FHA) protein